MVIHVLLTFRLFADILNDLAIFMEILAPNFKDYFIPIVCIAGVCKVDIKYRS
jgi:hypothetical protein